MSEEKKGFLSRIFGARKSCCCGVKIEEVAEDQPKEPKVDEGQPSATDDKKPGGSCCCGE
jgi:hypothetical protein